MSSIYADTSSLVKFYYPEAGSDGIEAILLNADRIFRVCDKFMGKLTFSLFYKTYGNKVWVIKLGSFVIQQSAISKNNNL